MVTAKIMHQNYIPYGYFAIEFCGLEFFGDAADKYQKEWDEVRFNLYQENQREIENKKGMSRTLRYLNEELQENIKKERKNRPLWHFWSTKQEKEYKDQIKHNKNTIIELCGEISDLENYGSYSPFAMLFKAQGFLKNHNFIFKSSSPVGTDHKMYIEMWELDE